MEDAAELANALNRILHRHDKSIKSSPSSKDLSTVLQDFEKKRLSRLNPLYKVSRLAIRLQAREGLSLKLFGRYLLPYLGDKVADWASSDIADGAIIEYLPQPQRSGPGWERFKQRPKGVAARFTVATIAGFLFILIIFQQYFRI